MWIRAIVMEYSTGSSDQVIELSSAVLTRFKQHRQLLPGQLEAGGQLFARFDDGRIIVDEATGPRASDCRTVTSFAPNRREEQAEINDRHSGKLHYIGDWHTHPEECPCPSSTDIASIGECVRRSTHDLNGFLLIVVGRAEPPRGIYVLLHDGVNSRELQPKATPSRD